MKSFIYIMGVALLLVFCSCEKQGEQEQGTQRTEQGQGEKPEPESPEEPPLVENWDLIEITRAEVGNSNYEELLYLASLAGLVNRSSPEIFLHSGQAYVKWMTEMKASGYTFTKKSLSEITSLFLNRAKGYVLVDDKLEKTYIAASLAGVLDAVILTTDLASKAPYNSLQKLADVRDKDEAWLADYIKQHSSQFNLNAIVNNASFPWTMVDFAIANRYPWCSNAKSDGAVLQKLYYMLKPNSPHYGWGVPYNLERMDVRFGCEHNGVYTVPGINTMSLSILSSKQLKPYDRPASPVEVPARTGVHYATIVFSDGDNTSYMLDLFPGIPISRIRVHMRFRLPGCIPRLCAPIWFRCTTGIRKICRQPIVMSEHCPVRVIHSRLIMSL